MCCASFLSSAVIATPFYRGGSRHSERVNDLSQATQLRASEIQSRSVWLQLSPSHPLDPLSYSGQSANSEPTVISLFKRQHL